MTLPKRIPTEIVQLFSSAEAWSYRLIPYARKDGTVLCAGEQGHDYASASQEIEVLSGFRVQIESVGPDELSLLLNRYYRREGTRPISGRTADLSRIGSGQGFLTDLIGEAFDEYASDIHFEPYEERCRIRLRIDGKLIEKYVLDRSGYASIVNQIKIMANLDISERRLPQDGHFRIRVRQSEYVNIRVSLLPTVFGEKAVLRILATAGQVDYAGHFGMDDESYARFLPMLNSPNGIIYITGPTGSGKSTTLYMVLEYLSHRQVNISTVEDPVEKNVPSINQTQVNPVAGLTFESGLRALLRQDPDIIMVGETRDGETAGISVRAAITGHLVLSTLHTNDAVSSIVRLADMGIDHYLIANSLVGLVAQRLMRKVCPHCGREVAVTPQEQALLGKDITTIKRGTGCTHCNGTGYRGRIAVHEIVTIDRNIRRMISRGAEIEEIEAYAREQQGMRSLKEKGLELVKQGVTTPEELLRIAYYA